MYARIKTSLFLVFFGLFVWSLNMGLFSFWKWTRDWPWILIIIGMAGIVRHLFRNERREPAGKPDREAVADIRETLDRLAEGKITAREAADEIKGKA